MPKFLNHLNLNGNQLKNAKLEITDSPLAEEGVIHYHDTTNTVRYHDGSNFITLGDNDTATTSAAGVVKLFNDTDVTESGVNAITATANRWYGVQLTENDKMVVNVPWTDSSALTTEQVQDIIGGGVLVHSNHTGITATYDDANNELDLAVDGVLEDLDTLGAPASDGQFIVATGSGAFAYESGATVRTSLNVDVAGTDNSTDVTLATVANNYLSISGQAITAGTVPVSLGGTGATTASGARTALDVDQAGTDNSTNVTLVTSSHDYLSISSQAITLGAIDLTADVTGDLPISEGGTGQSTAAAAANALLNTSQGGALTIGDNNDTITIAGNLTVTGTQTTTLSNTVKTGDNMLELATNNSANSTDFGWYGKFVDSGTKYAGMHWDASATKFKLGYGDDVPGGTVTWDNAGELETGKLTTTDFVIGGHTVSDIDIGNEFNDVDDHLMSAGAIKEKIESYSYLTAHPNISAASSVDNSGRTYIQDITLDSNGHVTGIVSATETVTNTNTMGSGFTVSATTDTTPTTITENDDLFFAAGSGISCETTADGTVTITNSRTVISNNNQLTNGANYITASANITGTAAGITAGAVGAVKVVELTHGAGGVTNENGSNSTDSAVWTIAHGMGASRFYKVEVVQDSGNYDTVYVDVTRPSDTTIVVTFGSDVANGAYRAMITRMA
tara:strand:+ start:2190 stop:4223 length:2034 start_codon:yes stop_codon:yes gene_type:complete